MQRAFNKTIIKLQNTSRMSEEQVRDVSIHSEQTWTDALVQSESESVQTRGYENQCVCVCKERVCVCVCVSV